MKSIPVTYRDRPEGSDSKLNTYSDGFKVLKTILRLFKDYRPFAFCGTISLVFLVVALALFLPVLFEFFGTGIVDRLTTLVTSAFLRCV